MQEVGDAIYALLTQATAVTSLLGTYNTAAAVFPDEAPKQLGTGVAYIVVKQPSRVDEYTMDGDASLAHTRFQIDCIAPTYAAAKQIRDAVRTALQGYRGTVITAGNAGTTIQSCFLDGQHSFVTPSPSDENLRTFGRSMDFIVWHNPY